MKNILKKSWLVVVGCMMASTVFADNVTFEMSKIFTGDVLTVDVTSPVAATVSTNTSKSNASSGKLGSDGNYIQIILKSDIFTAASIHGFINTNNTEKYWAFQFSTDGGANWGTELTQANDGNKNLHDITVGVQIPANANGFRVIRRAGTSSTVSSVTLTLGSSTPAVPVSGISLNKTSLTLEQGNEETLTATITPSDATNKGVTWSSDAENVASVVNGKVTALAVGTATITATADGDNTKTATCTVNVTENTHPTAVEGITLSKTSLSLKVGATETLTYTITPQNATNKNVSWSSSAAGIAGVDNMGKVTANAEGYATITVKTADGNKTATCAVTVTAANPVPPTDLTTHEPEIYEAKGKNGYNTPLTVFDGREYEVYYFGKAKPEGASSDIAVAYTQNSQIGYLVTSLNSTTTSISAADGWFESNFSGLEGSIKEAGKDISAKANAQYEFADMPGDIQLKGADKAEGTDIITLHVKGYDQFSFVGRDGDVAGKSKQFIVRVDNEEQSFTVEKAETTRRFNLTSGEHVIEIKAMGSSNCKLFAFSLRVSQTPRVSHHKGNDSTQTILCGKAMQDVVYRVKYNEDTRLEWVGNAPTGVTLEKRGTAGVTDTLAVVGTPIGAAGVYTYRVVAYQNGAEVSEKTGKFTIQTKLIALTDTIVEGYVGEDIDEVQFQYYAPAESDVTVQWTSSTPAGIQTATAKNIFTISGVPTAAGNFPFAVSVAGGNSIKGELIITGSEIEANTILYLYKNKDTYNKGNIYKALKAAGYKLTERKIKTTGQRADEQYKKFIMVVISEDADATAQEALDICSRTDFPTPVLNLKSFTYSTSRLGWGYPNNGVFSNAAITVQQPSHPIFKGLNATQGGSIDILTINTAEELRKGIMPAGINNCSGSYCLAIAPKDSKEYGALGDLAVAIHEIPASLHGSKYILLPLGSECVLSSAGNTLLKNIVSYLTDASSDSGIQLPDLRISRFEVNGKQALIDEDASTISLSLEPGTDLTAIKPVITLAGTATVVMPDNKEAQNFAEHARDGITYVVTDYVNRHAYQVYITAEGTGLNDNTAEGIYFDGTTLHNPNGIALYVLDMMGRIMTYSNSNVDMSDFGHGMYLITTGSNSMKVVK